MYVSGNGYLDTGESDRRESLHVMHDRSRPIISGHSFSPFGDDTLVSLGSPNTGSRKGQGVVSGPLKTANISKTVSGSVSKKN